MTSPVLRQALAYAARGWPVFPCQPGQKTPATAHGYLDATTDPAADHRLVRPPPAAATWPSPPAPPAPTSSTSTSAARPATGSPPSPGSATPGCSTAPPPTSAPPAAACTSTSPAPASAAATCPPATWTSCPPAATSWPRPPRSAAGPTGLLATPGRPRPLDWAAVTALLHPQRQPRQPQPRQGQAPGRDLDHLARWVAAQPEGNRNAGLFWAANRALETDPAADLSPLAAAARQAGLADPEITRTLDSARRTSQPQPRQPDHQAEAN